jgi:hypothetical protein
MQAKDLALAAMSGFCWGCFLVPDSLTSVCWVKMVWSRDVCCPFSRFVGGLAKDDSRGGGFVIGSVIALVLIDGKVGTIPFGHF